MSQRFLSFDIGTKMLAFCDLCVHQKETSEESSFIIINDWGIKDISIANTKHDIHKVIHNLLNFLESFDVKNYDFILIENQPAFLNAIMKSIQIIIFTFFTMKKREFLTNSAIQFCSASNKIKVINQIGFDSEKIRKETTCLAKCEKGYKFSKQLSIILMYYSLDHFIQNKDDYYTYFNSSCKKDDLSDCFLQALYIINQS